MFRICQFLCPFIAWFSVPFLCVSKGLCVRPGFMCNPTGQLSAFCSSPAQTVSTGVEFGVRLAYKTGVGSSRFHLLQTLFYLLE